MGKVLTEIDLEDQTINDERILSLCKILKNHLKITYYIATITHRVCLSQNASYITSKSFCLCKISVQ